MVILLFFISTFTQNYTFDSICLLTETLYHIGFYSIFRFTYENTPIAQRGVFRKIRGVITLKTF